MKKKLYILLCLALALMMLTACGRKAKTDDKSKAVPTETPAPTATAAPTPIPTLTPTPTPTATPIATPAPVQIPLPKISKEPENVAVTANGSCTFLAQCDHADLAEWHFVSPDGSLDVGYQAVQNQFPALKITGGNTNELKIEGIPEGFSGCKVYCRFSNSAGSVKTSSAQLTVKSAAPTALHHGFVGSWVDEAAGIWIDISYKTEGSVDVNVCWSNSAWQRSHWQMMAYVYQDGIMVYDSCHSWIETGIDGSEYTILSESYDGTGSFYVKDGKLHWYNDLTGQLAVLVPA